MAKYTANAQLSFKNGEEEVITVVGEVYELEESVAAPFVAEGKLALVSEGGEAPASSEAPAADAPAADAPAADAPGADAPAADAPGADAPAA